MPGLYSLTTLAITSSLASAIVIAQPPPPPDNTTVEYPFMSNTLTGNAKAQTLVCLVCLSETLRTDGWVNQFCQKQEEQISTEYAETLSSLCLIY